MANITLDVLYNEIKENQKEMKQMHQELRELRGALIPEEEISDEEHKELDAIFKEMKAGKETNWRDVK